MTVPTGTVIHATSTVTISGTITVQAGAAQGLYQAATDLGYSTGGIALPKFSQRKTLNPGPFGGGNGGGSNLSLGLYGLGGGSLVILAEGSLTIESGGVITASGTSGGQETVSGFSDGGGAGGIIILASKTSVANDGTLTADGGNGAASISGTSDAGGGGGGGIIHLLAPSGQITLGTTHILGGSVGGGTTNGLGVRLWRWSLRWERRKRLEYCQPHFPKRILRKCVYHRGGRSLHAVCAIGRRAAHAGVSGRGEALRTGRRRCKRNLSQRSENEHFQPQQRA